MQGVGGKDKCKDFHVGVLRGKSMLGISAWEAGCSQSRALTGR